jgi:head-tail adaptor
MGLSKYYKDQVYILRPTLTQSAGGEEIKTYSTSSTVYAFLNQKAGGKEFAVGKEIIISDAIMFCQPTVSVTETDIVQSVETGRKYRVLYVTTPMNSLKKKMKFLTVHLKYSVAL